MSFRFPRYGVPLLFFALTGCDQANITVAAAPTAVTAGLTSSAIAFEPATLRPEFLPGVSCGRRSFFGARIIIVIRGDDVSVRGLRFRFTDLLGMTALPRVTSIPGNAPLSAPISSFPTSPIPIPGIAPMPMTSPIPIPGATQAFPFFLTFDCNVASEGTLSVFVDNVDRNGGMTTTELRARVGF
jgi:hypothetical protein